MPATSPGDVSLETRAEGYRRRAVECLALIELTKDDGTKLFFLEMATAWHQLAERAGNEGVAPLRHAAAEAVKMVALRFSRHQGGDLID